ncbi:MAG TPA: tetraacyldisaccharide 4'-kinase [Gemmatimonadaceae bacterium]
MSVATSLWREDGGWAPVARAALGPASLLYRAATGVRNTMYDRGLLSVSRPPVPVISVGNLAVGGTGKTPVAAWMASTLKARGGRPAIVMRGYGGDEPRVHELINPDVPVFVNADRAVGIREAARSGADIAVLDDAFQHRRVSRLEDVVLVSADQWREPIRLLPAGPWRELPSALSRASMVVITRKAMDGPQAESLLARLAPLTRTGVGAVAALEPGDLRNVVTGEARSLSDIRGSRVLAAAGIGDPDSFAAQLREAGAHVEMRSFPDHHVYDVPDIERLTRDANVFDHIVCTLKDAVKLGPRWPREGLPLWYVSLRCRIEVGVTEVSAMLDRVLAARSIPIDQAR